MQADCLGVLVIYYLTQRELFTAAAAVAAGRCWYIKKRARVERPLETELQIEVVEVRRGFQPCRKNKICEFLPRLKSVLLLPARKKEKVCVWKGERGTQMRVCLVSAWMLTISEIRRRAWNVACYFRVDFKSQSTARSYNTLHGKSSGRSSRSNKCSSSLVADTSKKVRRVSRNALSLDVTSFLKPQLVTFLRNSKPRCTHAAPLSPLPLSLSPSFPAHIGWVHERASAHTHTKACE